MTIAKVGDQSINRKLSDKRKNPNESIVALYGCSLTRAVHLEVLQSLELNDFLHSFKRFIAWRGGPRLICLDNGATFKAAEKWLK